MIRPLIELSKKMNLQVIVEGIEEPSQLAAVTDMGADEVQGYLLGLPSDSTRVDSGNTSTELLFRATSSRQAVTMM